RQVRGHRPDGPRRQRPRRRLAEPPSAALRAGLRHPAGRRLAGTLGLCRLRPGTLGALGARVRGRRRRALARCSAPAVVSGGRHEGKVMTPVVGSDFWSRYVFVMLSSDAVRRGVHGEMVDRLRKEGFPPAAAQLVYPEPQLIDDLYADLIAGQWQTWRYRLV